MNDLPTGLGPEGTKLWTSITDYYDLSPGEYRLLFDACQEADLIEAMTANWEANGSPLTAKGSQGQVVAHPAIQELRQHRNTLRGLIAAMKLPHPEDEQKLSRSEVGRIGAYAKHGGKGVRHHGAG